MSRSIGRVTAVGEVMWLRNRTRVRGVKPAHIASTTSSGSVIGSGSDWNTSLAWRCSATKVHVRSSAPYSWSVARISSPGSSGSDLATMFSAVVTFDTYTRSSAAQPT